MNKTCPFSMGGEITECNGEECEVFIDGECVLKKMSVSLYYIAQNLRKDNEHRRIYE